MSVVTVEAPTDPDDDDEGVFEPGQNFAPDCCARVPGHGGNCATADELRAQWRNSGGVR